MPAFADDFPSNGYMLEDMVYEEAATYNNMGVYDGTVTATAEYEDILYQIGAGTYLPAGSEYVSLCPVGSYCSGVTDATYNETMDQGATSCPSGYPNSFRGSSSDAHCYTTCTVGSANVAHATAVSGNDYYDDMDTCIATACENGYHLNESNGAIVQKTPLIDVDWGATPKGSGYINVNGSSVNADTYGLTEPGTWAVEFDYGTIFGESACVGTELGGAVTQLNSHIEGIVYHGVSPALLFGENGEEFIPDNPMGEARARYISNVMLSNYPVGGVGWSAAGFSSLFVDYDLDPSSVPEGSACVCRAQSMRGADGNTQTINGPWVYIVHTHTNTCVTYCGEICTRFRGSRTGSDAAAMLGALDFVVGGTCEGNEITINWTDAADEDIAANNAGMCTYGGDIRTPVAAMEKPGKTFVGWKFDVTE